MSENQHFKTRVKFFLQIFKTLPGPLKDENKILKKESGQVFQNIPIPRPGNSKQN
jgi:hypothetical protein